MRNWLVDIRKKRSLTQAVLARDAKISRAYYTQIENGVRSPSPRAAKRIAAVLQIPWTRFFEDEDDTAETVEINS